MVSFPFQSFLFVDASTQKHTHTHSDQEKTQSNRVVSGGNLTSPKFTWEFGPQTPMRKKWWSVPNEWETKTPSPFYSKTIALQLESRIDELRFVVHIWCLLKVPFYSKILPQMKQPFVWVHKEKSCLCSV